MNLDIQTEHVSMRPEWHRMIDDWVERCRTRYPAVLAVDLTLRHGPRADIGDEVEIVATAQNRRLAAAGRAQAMSAALSQALEALERQLSTCTTMRCASRHMR